MTQLQTVMLTVAEVYCIAVIINMIGVPPEGAAGPVGVFGATAPGNGVPSWPASRSQVTVSQVKRVSGAAVAYARSRQPVASPHSP